MSRRSLGATKSVLLWFLVFSVFTFFAHAAWPGKIVSQYALTSANDFPQRDPMDWRLLGSNDEGLTWKVLDERKGVIFSERHQRLVFKISNRIAFNRYRLEIGRVRKASEANSVQLAELELMGESEDDWEPEPIFADRITAQGENPNLEKIFSLFDGRADTKWLDFAEQNPATRSSWIQWQYTDHTGLVITNVAHVNQLRSQAAKQYPVRLEGWIVGALDAPGRWCLMDGTGNIDFQIASTQDSFSPGERVRVEGVSQVVGRRVELAEVRVTRQGAVSNRIPSRVSAGEAVEDQQLIRFGQISGRVSFVTRQPDGVIFELEENGHFVSVRVLHSTPEKHFPVTGERVQVTGACESVFNSRGERVVGMVWAATLKSVIPLEPAMTQTPSSSDDQNTKSQALRLDTIRRIRQLEDDRLSANPKITVAGIVTDLYGTYIEDETGGVELIFRPEQSCLTPTLGDYVVVDGFADWVDGDMAVRVENVKIQGKGKLPPAQPSSWSELSHGHGVDRWIEIEGVVHASDGSHVLLECEGEQALATIRSAPAAKVDDLVDAVVRMRGVGTLARDRHQVRGITLIVPSLEYVNIVQPASDVSALPVQKISSLLRGYGTRALRHRVKIEGVLTFGDGDRFFLQDETGSAMAVAKQTIVLTRSGHWVFWQSTLDSQTVSETDLKPGDRIEVIGFPELHGYSPVLTEAQFRRVGRAAPVSPIRSDAEGIFAGNLDSTLVRLEGVLLSKQTFGRKTVMEVRDGQRVFEAFVSGPVASVAPGSRVSVTGVCQTEPTPFDEFGNSIRSFKLLVGKEADIAVLQRPPWWDLKHTMIVASVLMGVLVIAAGWILLLRRQVEKRTTLLRQEIEERKRIELKMERTHQELLTTSRMAGMAEVATYVLHNVGNVLNTVNLLGSSIASDIRDSQVGAVRKLAELLESERGHLGKFVTEDPRGQKIPGYLKRLGGHLVQEQSEIKQKVASLAENIQHIKEIVATQHAYAKISGVWEIVPLRDIVEDALRMQGAIVTHHNIRLVRDYQSAPPLLVDRHRVLQILFNLLQNATYACEKSTASEKQITVRIYPSDDQHIAVSVIDNGVGIAPENLTRIFDQGFSTRKDGHGIGLHSSVLMAEDMGGTLKAFSAGPDQGASFTLELPLKQKDRSRDGTPQKFPVEPATATASAAQSCRDQEIPVSR
ncbi:MAG TPA: ATP-binding protein [Verrucomicrobiae bacterium]|nr:ATP-binding protein [Verrucomicrobiae bacterium]